MPDSFDRPRRIDPERDILTPERVRVIEETRRFHARLLRRPFMTYMLLGVIFFFWVVSQIIALMVAPPEGLLAYVSALFMGTHGEQEALIRLGSKVTFLIDQGQIWRFVSPIFLHFGLLHLLFNSYALYLLGRIIENIYGRWQFLLIFFFAGILSIVASYYGTRQMSVGASGAIFGLLGAATVVGFKHRSEIPPLFQRFLGRGMMPWILLNLSLGLFIDGIDNYAHIGGLVAGSLMALGMRPRFESLKPDSFLVRAGIALAGVGTLVLTVAISGIMLANAFEDQVLEPPEKWQPIKDADGILSAEVPELMVRLDLDQPYPSWQYVEPNMGFWIALEREPDSRVTLENVVRFLKEDMRNTDQVDISSVEILSDVHAEVGGYPARLVHMRFKLRGSSMTHELEIWVAPTSKGLVEATCSAPRSIYALYGRWCRAFVQSIQIRAN